MNFTLESTWRLVVCSRLEYFSVVMIAIVLITTLITVCCLRQYKFGYKSPKAFVFRVRTHKWKILYFLHAESKWTRGSKAGFLNAIITGILICRLSEPLKWVTAPTVPGVGHPNIWIRVLLRRRWTRCWLKFVAKLGSEVRPTLESVL